MAMDFPTPGSVGEIITRGSKRFQWTGEQWAAYNNYNDTYLLTLINQLSTNINQLSTNTNQLSTNTNQLSTNINQLSTNMTTIGNYPYVLLTHTIPSSSYAGGMTLVKGTETRVPLNTKKDINNICNLSGNVFTLQTGTYRFQISFKNSFSTSRDVLDPAYIPTKSTFNFKIKNNTTSTDVTNLVQGFSDRDATDSSFAGNLDGQFVVTDSIHQHELNVGYYTPRIGTTTLYHLGANNFDNITFGTNPTTWAPFPTVLWNLQLWKIG